MAKAWSVDQDQDYEDIPIVGIPPVRPVRLVVVPTQNAINASNMVWSNEFQSTKHDLLVSIYFLMCADDIFEENYEPRYPPQLVPDDDQKNFDCTLRIIQCAQNLNNNVNRTVYSMENSLRTALEKYLQIEAVCPTWDRERILSEGLGV